MNNKYYLGEGGKGENNHLVDRVDLSSFMLISEFLA